MVIRKPTLDDRTFFLLIQSGGHLSPLSKGRIHFPCEYMHKEIRKQIKQKVLANSEVSINSKQVDKGIKYMFINTMCKTKRLSAEVLNVTLVSSLNKVCINSIIIIIKESQHYKG